MKKPSLVCEGTIYKTQVAMRKRAQDILDSWEYGEEHESEFFFELIKQRHHACIDMEEYPIKFKREYNKDFPDPHHLHGFFINRGWRAISWVKAVNFLSTEEAIEKNLNNFFRLLTWMVWNYNENF